MKKYFVLGVYVRTPTVKIQPRDPTLSVHLDGFKPKPTMISVVVGVVAAVEHFLLNPLLRVFCKPFLMYETKDVIKECTSLLPASASSRQRNTRTGSVFAFATRLPSGSVSTQVPCLCRFVAELYWWTESWYSVREREIAFLVNVKRSRQNC